MRLGIISALAEEQQGLLQALQSPATRVHGMREYTTGKLWEIDAVCVLSRIGKVAGSGDPHVNVGDIVVADSLVQHDMDASPLFPRFEVPLTGLSRFASDVALTERLAAAAAKTTRVHRGLIASGDQFIGRLEQIVALKTALPDLLAVEMEGAAVAQVCFELGIPFAVIRTISDNANDDAAVDFLHFIETVASRYAFEVIENFCKA